MVARNKVIAHHVVTIPPAGFDSFRTIENLQCAIEPGASVMQLQPARLLQQPGRAQQGRTGLGKHTGFGFVPGEFGTRVREQRQAVHGIVAKPCAQPFHQCGAFLADMGCIRKERKIAWRKLCDLQCFQCHRFAARRQLCI